MSLKLSVNKEKTKSESYLLDKCSQGNVEPANITSISLLVVISKRIRTAQFLESMLYPVYSKQMNSPSA